MANPLTRLFGRAARALGRRQFDAAGHGDRWPKSSLLWSPVSQSLAAAGPIAHRADWLAANSPSAASFVECWITNLVATGPTVRSGHPDEATRRLLEQRWARWTMRCDAEGNGDLAAFLAKAVRALVISGDCFTHQIIADRQLRLKLIATEQVARAWTRVLPQGQRIFAGVEVDQHGRRVAYWCYPYQWDLPWAQVQQPERISAEDLLHVFKADFPGAVRGISWLTPIAARLLELDRLEDALLARMNVAALFAGFIKDLDGTAFSDAKPLADKLQLSLEPGALRVLPQGTDVVFPSNIPDTAGSADFMRHMLRSIAAGGGVPASLLTGDLSDVNYSSARMGLESFKRSIGRIQQSHLVAQLLQPIWERFITVEILSGRLAAPDFERDPEAYLDVDFRWPAWPSLDPSKDATADETLLNNNLTSRAELIAKRGRDIEDVDAEITADTMPRRATPKPAPQPTEQTNA